MKMGRIPCWLLLCLCLGASPILAEADGPDFWRVRDVARDDVLNIREAPDPSARIVGAIPSDGDGIRNLGCTGRMGFAAWQTATEAERAAAAHRVWCQVEYNGVSGWSAGRYLGEGSAP